MAVRGFAEEPGGEALQIPLPRRGSKPLGPLLLHPSAGRKPAREAPWDQPAWVPAVQPWEGDV